MTTPADIADLIAQLEGATGGSRELDARIYGFLNGIEPAETLFVIDAMQFHDPKNSEPPWRAVYVKEVDVPAYSASIDAATLLIPAIDAGRFSIDPNEEAGEYTGKWDAFVCGSGWVTAAAPALALCLACLKARLDFLSPG